MPQLPEGDEAMKDADRMSTRELRAELKARRFAMVEFVERCERGEVLSKYTYSLFKAINDEADLKGASD